MYARCWLKKRDKSWPEVVAHAEFGCNKMNLFRNSALAQHQSNPNGPGNGFMLNTARYKATSAPPHRDYGCITRCPSLRGPESIRETCRPKPLQPMSATTNMVVLGSNANHDRAQKRALPERMRATWHKWAHLRTQTACPLVPTRARVAWIDAVVLPTLLRP